MATQTVQFKKSRYFSRHPYLSENFVRNTLVPELKKQGALGLASPGIELKETGEYITIGEAKELVFDYLINEANLGERDQRTLRGVVSHTSFADLADAHLNREITEPKTLGATTPPDQVSDLQSQKTAPRINQPEKFSSDKTIRDYNDLYQKILRHGTTGDPAKILARLFPGGVSSATNIKQVALAQVIVANLTKLEQASQTSNEREVQNYAVAQELSQSLGNHPDVVAYRNFLGNGAIQATVREYVDSITEAAKQDSPKVLEQMDRLQLAYGQKLRGYMLNESELRTQIYNALPLVRDNERVTLTDQILRTTTKGSLDGASLEQVLTELKLDQNAQSQIYAALHNQGIDVSLKYQQDKLRLQLESHELTAGEKRLLKKGINPFLTSLNPNSDKLVNKEKELLAGYNAKAGNNKQFVTLQEAYANEREKASPDPLFLSQARDILNRQGYYASLSRGEQNQVEFTRFGRWVTNTTSRIRDIQDKFTDSIFDLTDTVTGKKWLYKQWDKFDAFTAKITIPGTQIPLFHINNWVANQWDKFKKAKVEGWITKTAGSTGWLGKTTHRRLKDYRLGGFTLKGMTAVGLHRAWSNLAYKASAGVIRQGAIFSFRTATRFFLKVGAKSIAKITFKLGEMAAAGLMSASGILTALGVVLLVKDVLEIGYGIAKWGWGKLKQIFGSTEGAATAVVVAAIVGFTWWATKVPRFILSSLALLALPAVVTIVMVFSVAFGSIYLFTYLGGNNFNITTRLESGSAQQVISDIVCTLTGSEAPSGAANSKLAAGKCLVELLTKFGINPLTESNAVGVAFNSFSAGLGNSAAAAEAHRSATSYKVFQCVGFDVVVDIMTGGSGTGFGNANTLLSSPPSGYRPVLGVGSCSPGDFFVDTSGKVGHTGIFVSNAGPYIKCMDANGGGPGLVRDENSCVWPTASVAGCLKKI